MLANIAKDREFVNPFKYFLLSIIQGGYLGHFWYLWALVFLYALSPILIKIFNNKRYRYIFLYVIISVCLIVHLCTVFLSLDGLKTIEQLVPQTFRIWSHLMYYYLGGVLFNEISSEDLRIKQEHRPIILLIAIGLSTFEYLICTQVLKLHSPENLFNSPVVMCVASLWFILFNTIDYNSSWTKLIEKLIPYSLGMYIIHPFIINIMSHFNLFLDKYWLINFLILSVGSFIASYIISKIKYLNKIIKL